MEIMTEGSFKSSCGIQPELGMEVHWTKCGFEREGERKREREREKERGSERDIREREERVTEKET